MYDDLVTAEPPFKIDHVVFGWLLNAEKIAGYGNARVRFVLHHNGKCYCVCTAMECQSVINLLGLAEVYKRRELQIELVDAEGE